jgi:orotidine-5'-phosphate decarboxylase
MNFADRLIDAIDRKGTPSLVGIDPRYEMLPAGLKRGDSPDRAAKAAAIGEFARRVIDVVAPLVPAVKPNLAFFEAHGWEGYREFMRVVGHAREKGLLVIADAKRGDIGSTAKAYADSIFLEAGADAVTLSPWLGRDSLDPFFEYASEGRGFFLLVKTSNPSSADLQDLERPGGTVFEAAADLVTGWGSEFIGESGMSAVGAVVGATFPEQAAALRQRMPHTPFLLPGYGVQGGKAETLKSAFAADGSGALVNSSRGINFAFSKEPYASELGEERWEEAVERATLAMRADLAGAVPDARWNRES